MVKYFLLLENGWVGAQFGKNLRANLTAGLLDMQIDKLIDRSLTDIEEYYWSSEVDGNQGELIGWLNDKRRSLGMNR